MSDYNFRTNLEETNKTPTGPVRDNPKFSAPKIERPSAFKTFLEDEVDRNIQRDLGAQALQAYKDNDIKGFYKAAADRGKDQLKYTAGSLAMVAAAPTVWTILNNPVIQTGLTIDGIKNAFSDNGWRKTQREYLAGNYKNAALSGLGDILDVSGGVGLLSKILKISKAVSSFPTKFSRLTELDDWKTFDKWRDNIIASWKKAQIKEGQPPSTFSKRHPTGEDRSVIKFKNNKGTIDKTITVTDDLPMDRYIESHFDNVTSEIARARGYKSPYLRTDNRIALFSESGNSEVWNGFFLPEVEGRSISNYIFLNKNKFSPSTPYHELHHNRVYNGMLPKTLTPQDTKAIHQAYPTPRNPKFKASADILEKRAVNEELRAEFTKLFYDKFHRYPIINNKENELYSFLMNMSDNDFREGVKYIRQQSGYMSDYLSGMRELTENGRGNAEQYRRNLKWAISSIPVLAGFGLYSGTQNNTNTAQLHKDVIVQ